MYFLSRRAPTMRPRSGLLQREGSFPARPAIGRTRAHDSREKRAGVRSFCVDLYELSRLPRQPFTHKVPAVVSGHQRDWDTAVLPETDQFSFWREVVWEAFVPVTLSRSGPDAFSGGVAASQIGPLGVAAIASEAQVVERTVADVRRNPGEVF